MAIDMIDRGYEAVLEFLLGCDADVLMSASLRIAGSNAGILRSGQSLTEAGSRMYSFNALPWKYSVGLMGRLRSGPNSAAPPPASCGRQGRPNGPRFAP
jgi:hypothetical protein